MKNNQKYIQDVPKEPQVNKFKIRCLWKIISARAEEGYENQKNADRYFASISKIFKVHKA